MEVIVDGFIYQQQQFGGVSRVFSEILPRMCQIDPTLQIQLFTTGKSRQELPKHSGIQHQSLFPVDDLLRPHRLWGASRLPARRLVQWATLKNTKEALWHSTFFTMPLGWDGPKVVTVHDMIYELFPDYFSSKEDERIRRLKRNCVISADIIICVSETTLNDVKGYYGIDSSRLRVIHSAYNKNFRQIEASDCSGKWVRNKPYLLYIGKRGPYKNFNTLLKAYCVWNLRNEVDLLVVGADWSGSERKWLENNLCKEQVHLLQGVDDRKLACLYNNAQAFVYPSLYEGFGLPLLEAMACGCPIVASRIPSTVEVAGEQPYYFEAQDVDGLMAALDGALKDGRKPEKIQSSIKRAQGYSWETSAARTLQVYHSLEAG